MAAPNVVSKVPAVMMNIKARHKCVEAHLSSTQAAEMVISNVDNPIKDPGSNTEIHHRCMATHSKARKTEGHSSASLIRGQRCTGAHKTTGHSSVSLIKVQK